MPRYTTQGRTFNLDYDADKGTLHVSLHDLDALVFVSGTSYSIVLLASDAKIDDSADDLDDPAEALAAACQLLIVHEPQWLEHRRKVTALARLPAVTGTLRA